MLKPTLIAAALAASLAGFAPVAATAQTYTVRIAPPPPRDELAPAPRRGYVWVPGYWNWNAQRSRHKWVDGTWVRERRGYYYNEPRWVERDGRWVLNRGAWARGQRDRDGDGIPNRIDRDRDGDGVSNRRERDRDGDGIPNRTDRDRDGDGVRNRYDSNPNNPRRN